LSGRKAFEGESWVAVAAARLARDPRPLSELRPELPRELLAIITHCLARDPADRYASAQALRDALAAVDDRPLSAAVPPALAVDEWTRPPPAEIISTAPSPDRAPQEPRPEPGGVPTRRLDWAAPAATRERPESPLLALLRAEHPFWAPIVGAVIAFDILLLVVLLRMI
jgi:serine/threonine-protein kinase